MKQNNRVHLTNSIAEKAIYVGTGGARQILWDDEVLGLGLRVFPSGKKSFVLSYRAHGIKRLMVIGNFGLITAQDARKLATVLKGEVARECDPLIAKKEKRRGETVKDICEDFLANRPHLKDSTRKEYRRRIDDYIVPAIGNRKAKAIHLRDLMDFHKTLGLKSRVEANRTVTLLGTIYDVAVRRGNLASGFPNPARGIEKFPEKSRDRWVTHEELPKLAEAIDKEENIFVRSAIWLLLLTGARKSEILNLQWADVNLFRREVKFTNTKNGTDHYVPLSEPAMAIIEALPRVNGNPYLLPGHVTGKPLVNIAKPWDRIRAAAETEGLRIHDLRRSLGSWCAQRGNSLHLIGKILNHKSEKSTAIYARFAQDQVRAALEEHGNEVFRILNGSNLKVAK